MNPRLLVLVAAVLALTALALFVVVPAVGENAAQHYALGFADDYDVLGKNLAEGRGYRMKPDTTETMMREPGYPLLLAGLFTLLGYGLEAARLANLLLAGATALLLWHLARRVLHEEAAALAAVALFLLHPGTLVAEARGGVEILFIFGAVGFMLLLYRAQESGRALDFALAGVALGATVLVRSTPLLFPLVLLPYLVLAAPRGERLRRAALGGALAGAMALVIAPWVLRNYMLSGAFVPTATVQGVAAQEGQYTCRELSLGRGFQSLQSKAAAERRSLATQAGLRFTGGYYQHFYTVSDELAFNRGLLERTFSRYREEPGLLARCSAANLLHFWFLGKNGFATAANVALQLPLLALALAGLLALRRRRPAAAWAPVALFVAYIVAVHVPIIAHARHSVPLVPFLAIFAAPALLAAARRYGARRARPAQWKSIAAS